MEKFKKFFALEKWYLQTWCKLNEKGIDIDYFAEGYFPGLLGDLFESYLPELSYERYEDFEWDTFDNDEIRKCYEYCLRKGEM